MNAPVRYQSAARTRMIIALVHRSSCSLPWAEEATLRLRKTAIVSAWILSPGIAIGMTPRAIGAHFLFCYNIMIIILSHLLRCKN